MFPQRQRMDLQGKWAFKLDVRGNGEESGFATAPFAEEVVLPGTTDTNRKGFRPARTDETTYLTRLHAYVGKAWYKKVVDIPESWKNKSRDTDFGTYEAHSRVGGREGSRKPGRHFRAPSVRPQPFSHARPA